MKDPLSGQRAYLGPYRALNQNTMGYHLRAILWYFMLGNVYDYLLYNTCSAAQDTNSATIILLQ